MIAAIKAAGFNTRGLLAYLYGPGRHDEHLDPHLVAAFAMLGMPDPGRDENATLTELGFHLDEPVHLRNGEFGKKVTDHVWHCPVRAAPEDRYLSDAEWGEIAQRIVQAAGIAPAGDDLACRWIAVRHADDHIHILATTVREDGRRPKLHDSGIRVGDACREIEKDYGLRRLKKGDRTGTRRPTQAEMHKADRLGWEQTSREWLQDRIRSAIPHATSTEELLAYLEAGDILVKPRRGPSGDLLGYAVSRPGDLNKDGEQIYHPGGKIAPDLSLPKLKACLETSAPEEHPTARRNRPATAWHQATETLDTLHTETTRTSADDGGDARAQAHITALGELIEATAQKAPGDIRAQLHAASRAFARAQRSQVRAEDRAAHALRTAARDITHTATGPDGSALAALTAALLWAAILAARWHEGPRGTLTRPTPPAKPFSTCSQPPTTRSVRRSPSWQPGPSRRRPVASWPTTYVQLSPNTPSGSSPIPVGPRSPGSSPMPKPAATNPTNSSRKPPPAVSSALPTGPPAS